MARKCKIVFSIEDCDTKMEIMEKSQMVVEIDDQTFREVAEALDLREVKLLNDQLKQKKDATIADLAPISQGLAVNRRVAEIIQSSLFSLERALRVKIVEWIKASTVVERVD